MSVRQPFSLVALLVSFGIYFLLHHSLEQAKNANPFVYDQAGYYNYLPALFIHQDLSFSYLEEAFKQQHVFLIAVEHTEGEPVVLNRYGYTPLMSLGVLGLLFLYQQQLKLVGGISLYAVLNLYLISCWWCLVWREFWNATTDRVNSAFVFCFGCFFALDVSIQLETIPSRSYSCLGHWFECLSNLSIQPPFHP